MSAPAVESVCVGPISIAQLPSTSALRILPLPDLHLPGRAGHEEPLLAHRQFLDQHDWVVLLGDMICCYGTPGEYGHVSRFVRQLARPYSVVNGNHEFIFQPQMDGTPAYGKIWEHSPPGVQQQQFQRFERFYGIPSRFQAGRHHLAGFCLLGIDEIAPDDSCRLKPQHEAWFAGELSKLADLPLLVFCHFPIADVALREVRYYVEGRRPCYIPPPEIDDLLRRRSQPTFWFSGHLHFAPSHHLFAPYLTQSNVWQVHCPDGAGYGRPNNDKWHPEVYEGLFVRSIVLEEKRLTVTATDLSSGKQLPEHSFDLPDR